MKYFYYSGCSLEGTALEYDISTRAVMQALGVELIELDDWTCCGASAAEAVSELLSMVLPARNLALAARMDQDCDFVIPCSACYLNLRKVDEHLDRDEGLREKINAVLQEEELSYKGGIKSRHLLDVLATDIGAEMIKAKVNRKLSGLRIAPYYGCQALRPYGGYDDPEEPRCMEPLIEALGAEVHPWPMGAKCCGAGLMTTKKEIALELTGELLKAAKGADCIATVCPMCQMNLDSYQKKVSQVKGEDLRISVLYLPQLIGMAFGLNAEALKLDLNMAYTDSLRTKLKN
ncbi:MAG: CoB--CoM heterodisulfide reductase iron-sulfur subunit B family protein [Deltaproteobacteria bacterium]|jgi:heterodisulfide reductase subunit B|nr:CoB--CoM heterodisulfide reductase iron-sulfur subunit B family protein [Deltaproteobacteria bacterium]